MAFHTTISTKQFARALVSKMCLGRSSLVNRKRVRRNIRYTLRRFERKSIMTMDALFTLASKLQAYLSILKPEYNITLPHRLDRELEIDHLVTAFFVRRGWVMEY